MKNACAVEWLFILAAISGCPAHANSPRVLSHPPHQQPIYEVVFADSARDEGHEVMKLMIRYVFRNAKGGALVEGKPFCVSTPDSLFIGDDYLKQFGANIKAAKEHCKISISVPVHVGVSELKIDVIYNPGPMMLTIETYTLRRLNEYWHLVSHQLTAYS